MKKLKIVFPVLALLIAGGMWYATSRADKEQAPVATHDIKENEDTKEPAQSFDTSKHSIDDPNSIWVVVNKQRPLDPPTYKPDDLVVPDVRLRVPGHETMQLRNEAARALESMFADAKTDGIELMLSSAYRSYEYQENLYNGYVRSQGRQVADTQSARPGHSEHQTGLAADLRPVNGECELEACFGDMAEGKWVAANAHEYGFIIRYTPDNQQTAGYSYEPWHIRYVGKELAVELRRVNASSLETFFGLEAAADYN